MKLIDLLNKIANGEEVPKKIEYNGDIYIHVDNYCYFCEETNEILSQNIYAEFSRLNDEVEIIKDNYENFEIDKNGYIHTKGGIWKGRKLDIELVNKINELEKEINELKNKED